MGKEDREKNLRSVKEETSEWRRITNQELTNLYKNQSITNFIKKHRARW